MMEEIQTNGPITAGFKYYTDFGEFRQMVDKAFMNINMGMKMVDMQLKL